MPPTTGVAEDQHASNEARAQRQRIHTINGGRACGEHFRDPTGTLRAEVLCQASRSSLNGRMRSNTCHPRRRVAAHRVILCHHCMPPCRVPGPVCRETAYDRRRHLPLHIVLYSIHVFTGRIAISLMCRYTCEAALAGRGHGMTDSPKLVRKATFLLPPCLSTSFSYHSPRTRLRQA